MPSDSHGEAVRGGPGPRWARRLTTEHRPRAPLPDRSVVSAIALTTALLSSAVGTGTYVAARGHDLQAPAVGVAAVTASRTAASRTADTGTADTGTGESVAMRLEPKVDWDKVLADALDDVSRGASATWSLAILDIPSGHGAVHGGVHSAVHGDGAFDTASIVKVDILATLLLQAQDAGRRLTAHEKGYARTMIENSDNAAATALWKDIGRASGLMAANKRFGLTGTEGGDGLLWGLTQTTAADQLRLLDTVFAPGGDADDGTGESAGDAAVLSDASRSYIRALMGRVSAGQDWGVPSAAADGTGYEVKNGWLRRSTTGLWDINSIGRVTFGGHKYLVAVLSKGSATQASGIALVEDAAQAAVRAFGEAAGRGEPAAVASSEAPPARQATPASGES